MALIDLIKKAEAADDAFESACRAEGWKSRWDMAITPRHSQFLRDAYFVKVDADSAVHDAFEASRKES